MHYLKSNISNFDTTVFNIIFITIDRVVTHQY